MKTIKNIFKQHSIYMLIVTILEVILSTVCTIAFVYSDTLSYSDSLVYNTIGIEKLLESIYSSTWWALILFLLAFIAICSITTLVYKKMSYMFMGILGWIEMLILSINLSKPLLDLGLSLLLFIPIFLLNIIAYKSEKKKIEENNNIISKIKTNIEEKEEVIKKNTKKTKNSKKKKASNK